MNANDNTVTTANINSDIKNKGFLLIDNLFKENDWIIKKNELDWIEYNKPGYELDIFQIKIDKTNIHVNIPIKNSRYQYKTSFNNYYDASEYIENRFKDFIS